MSEGPTEFHRYLARVDTRYTGHLYTDCLVIGSGVAGLRAALEAAKAGSVRILCKDVVTESNTYYAQGGIAAVLKEEDSFASHIEDTLGTGGGLCDEAVVEKVVREGPEQIRLLEEWSAPLDREGKEIAVGREGGHRHARIVHALGDATGRAVAETLLEQVRRNRQVKIFEQCYALDLLTEDGCCFGVLTAHPHFGWQCIWARQTILATGGVGQVWRETTNPEGATGDGLAMAYRAGVRLQDLEFMQFHPTTLYIAGAARTLITEALRGEGARLVNRRGERFMEQYHEMGELAPRDVVSRAIYQDMLKNGDTHVYLDVRHLGAEWLKERFPTISQVCLSFDIDVDKDLIPVRPSAHYMVGGVTTDIRGRTSLEHLYCCGEAAATGLHGSNRLASNSLLEGLVFGRICGEQAAETIAAEGNGDIERRRITYDIEPSSRTRLDVDDVRNSLRAVMWRNVGVKRQGQRLEETLEIVDFWSRYVMDKVFDEPEGWECQNMLTVSRLVAQAAWERRESRGVHFRQDFPQRDDEHFARHLEVQRKSGGE